MRIRISALDTLFFRDGKPFTMGEETWADGVFPPYPSVLYGALRTWYIANHPDGISQRLIDESAGIRISSLHYRLPSGLHLPLPLDFVEPKNKKEKEKNKEDREKLYRVVSMELRKQNMLTNHPLPAIILPKDNLEVETVEDGLVSNEDFKQYLEGTLQEIGIRRLKDAAQTEPKVGIGRTDSTNTTDEGKLYRVGMRRATDFEIIVEVTLPDEQFQYRATFIKLGGEGKIATIEEKGRMDSLQIEKDSIGIKSGKFKLYLSSPAIFKKGWKPDLESMGIKAQLIAAVLGKPVHIGGFDMAKKSPKPMLKAVPAGSVYYYETNEPAELILEKLQGESISDFLRDQGFGIAYIGNY